MRKPIIAANWKMNKTIEEAEAFTRDFIGRFDSFPPDREIVLIPPSIAIFKVREAVKNTPIHIGAQNVHQEPAGAYTGELSAGMLNAAGCEYVVIGHSERRCYFSESNYLCNVKIHAAFSAGLTPIYCIGETLEQRENDVILPVVEIQVREGLIGLTAEDAAKVVIAYEPVWAIGTGRTATTDQAQEVHASIRQILAESFNKETAQQIRIQYGGSVKPANIDDLMAMPDIDGALVGGAGLDPESFANIVLFKK